MERKIINPFAGTSGYNCFGCSPDNKLGLQLSFANEGEYIVAQWLPSRIFRAITTFCMAAFRLHCSTKSPVGMCMRVCKLPV